MENNLTPNASYEQHPALCSVLDFVHFNEVSESCPILGYLVEAFNGLDIAGLEQRLSEILRPLADDVDALDFRAAELAENPAEVQGLPEALAAFRAEFSQ